MYFTTKIGNKIAIDIIDFGKFINYSVLKSTIFVFIG